MVAIDELIEEFKQSFYACKNDDLLRIHNIFEEESVKNPKLLRKLDFAEYLRFKDEMEYFDLCWHYLEMEDWSTVTESDEIKVESRGSGNEFFTKCTITIHQSILKVLAVLSEIDLITTWYWIYRVKVLTKIDLLAEPTITRKLTKYHFWFPWPLSNRQCVLEFNAVPLISQKACLITMKSPESENYMRTKIPPFEDNEVRMWIRIGCLYAQMIDENSTLVKFMISADGNIVRYI